jgi:hypothetical protein
MQPTDLIFSAVSEMTGGIINDVTTACLGVVVIFMIIEGFDYLKEVLRVNGPVNNFV